MFLSSDKFIDLHLRVGQKNYFKRRRTNAIYPEKEGVWEEFEASHTGEKYLDGKVIIDHFEGIFPDGEVRKGMTIRAYDEETKQWSLHLG